MRGGITLTEHGDGFSSTREVTDEDGEVTDRSTETNSPPFGYRKSTTTVTHENGSSETATTEQNQAGMVRGW